MSDLSHIPDGYHSVTPSLTVKSAAEAIEFYGKALGAVETFRLPDEASGKLMHAEFKVGNSTMMISDEYPEMGSSASEVGKGGAFMIYVADADTAFARAVEAGATALMPVTDMFWGDRMGQVADPYGYRWSFAQKVRDVSPEEIAEGMKSFGS